MPTLKRCSKRASDAQSRLNLQAAYELRVAEIATGKKIEKEVAVMSNAA